MVSSLITWTHISFSKKPSQFEVCPINGPWNLVSAERLEELWLEPWTLVLLGEHDNFCVMVALKIYFLKAEEVWESD